MSDPGVATFHGPAEQERELLDAVGRNCHCQQDAAGHVTMRCSVHLALRDQAFLDHLAFGRTLGPRLFEQEFHVSQPATKYVIGPGFAQYIADHGLTALGNERYFAQDYSMVLTDQGPLWYSVPENKVIGPPPVAPGQ